MRKLKALWRSAFDIREGERLRVLFMALYLFLVLFAHYILKPISRSMFVTTFGSKELPYLYVLIALVGGVMATLYTKVAMRASLKQAVGLTMALSAVSLLLLAWLLPYRWRWLVYGFNLWAQLFGVVTVAQGWLVAANVFSSREAKRVYGLVGLGAVAGGWTGALFTTATIKLLGNYRLLVIGAVLVGLAYVAFRLTIGRGSAMPAAVKAAEGEKESFSTRDIFSSIWRHRYLQVIAGIIVVTYVVDQLVEFQLQAAGEAAYGSDPTAYTRFLSTYMLVQNTLTFFLQFVFTGVVVHHLGVGGTLKLMPVCLAVASIVPFFMPNVWSAAAVRLTEAASRYSVNKAAMELLYLPLPVELRNRTKAFVDVFGDRLGRGLAGALLILLATISFDATKLPLLVMGLAGIWIWLTVRAQKEYVLTIRKRLESRRLDLESLRVSVQDPSLMRLLDETARGGSARQASYALSVLAEAPGYDLARLLAELAESPLVPVRNKVYELARAIRTPGLLDNAVRETRSGQRGVAAEAVAYVLAVSPEAPALAREFVNHADPFVVESALNAMASQPDMVHELITDEWLSERAGDPDPERRRMAAIAVGVRGDEGTEVVHRLLGDLDLKVASAACRAAGRLKNRAYVPEVVSKLADARLRGTAIDALAAYGTRICGTLGDLLEDDAAPIAIRRHIPRVLRLVADQRSADVLLRCISQRNLILRAAALRALSRLRETAPGLDYGPAFVTKQILDEAKNYYELHAALSSLRGQTNRRSAAGLLVLSIEERLQQTLERLFRLLGLRYPPKEIYAAYLGVHRRRRDQYAAALDFLENVLERDLKRVLLPLLEDSGDLLEKGRDLFGLEVKSPEQAVRELIRSGDPWLVACAMAAAADLKLRNLAGDIREASRGAGAEVCQVALAAQAALT
jgi:AAA family ATP:ADP antiporter